MFAASSPPSNFDPGILVGLVGFAFSLRDLSSSREARRRGFLFGLVANLVALRFVPEVMQRFTNLPAIAGWTALLLLSAAQAVPWLLAGWLARWLVAKRGLPSWLAFAICVYGACFIPAVFPWTPAGGLARWPILLQTAELVGERGTTFLLATACAFVAEAIRTKTADRKLVLRFSALSLATFALLLAYGVLRMASVESLRQESEHAKVAVLQPDFDAMFRWQDHSAVMMMDRLSTLTKRAESEGAVLTVWPESAYPYTLAHGTKSSPFGSKAFLQPGVHGPVITGAYLTKGGGLGTNSAVLVTSDGAIGPSYDKRHLLWFGETVPFGDLFPVLRRIFSRGTGLDPGTENIAFVVGPIRASVLNCYEDTLPIAGREAMSVEPNLLVNVTNDAWFAGSAEGELHLRLAVLRSIEARRDFVRAVNRGPTTWVDATGRIRMRRDATPGLGPSPPLVADVALLKSPITLYTRVGDMPLALGICVFVFVPIVRRRIQKRRGDAQSTTGAPPG